MKKHVLSITGLLLLAFISSAQNPVSYIKTDNYEGVIFSSPPYIVERSMPPYIPSEKEISTMEKTISGSVGKSFFERERLGPYNEYVCDFANTLKEYKRYYFGDWLKGEKIIEVSFFKKAPYETKGKEYLFEIEDGGCGYFKILYSVKGDTLFHLTIGSFP